MNSLCKESGQAEGRAVSIRSELATRRRVYLGLLTLAFALGIAVAALLAAKLADEADAATQLPL